LNYSPEYIGKERVKRPPVFCWADNHLQSTLKMASLHGESASNIKQGDASIKEEHKEELALNL